MVRGVKPMIDEMTFIQCWNKHSGDARIVAKELGMKYNSAWVRGTRLLKKYGVKNPSTKITFDLRFEDMKHNEK